MKILKSHRKSTSKIKTEFSKKILIAVGAVTLLVTAFTVIMIWMTKNLEPLQYLIPALFAELSIGTGFYYNKAKAENEIKLKKDDPEFVKDGDNNAVG